ncbi:MAG: chemotaxis protein CheX [Bdellovibrionota bacterium]
MNEFPKEVVSLIVQAVEELFQANNISSIEHVEHKGSPGDGNDYCAVIGFAGEAIKGSIAVAMGLPLLEASNPSKAMGMDVAEEDLADWLGEIANQIIGRVKNLILKYGVDFMITTPSVFHGKNINTMETKPESARKELVFKLDGFQMHLVALINLMRPIDFSVENEDAGGEEEGSSLFF